MREGSKFTAAYEGEQFPVIVPAGGCVKGQTLTVPFNPNAKSSEGRWRDDVFACTRYGIFHPSFCMACCLGPMLLGQVMMRLKLDWLGDPAPDDKLKNTFRFMVIVAVIVFLLNTIFEPEPDLQGVPHPSPIHQFISFVVFVYMVYAIMKVRKNIRMRDQIPESQCIGCEDLVCAACCGCCTISQMARQTADYDLKEAAFFTPDGLSPLAPAVVV